VYRQKSASFAPGRIANIVVPPMGFASFAFATPIGQPAAENTLYWLARNRKLKAA
jgi:hypothetical protein